MARLTQEQKRRIVERLACFDEPSAVAELVKEEFGIEVPRQQVYSYDPTRPQNSIARELEDLFRETRERFVSETDHIAIAHKSYRLERLQKMFGKAEAMRNYGLAAELLEQAAKEVGDAYTNRTRQEVTGKAGEKLTFTLNIGEAPGGGDA